MLPVSTVRFAKPETSGIPSLLTRNLQVVHDSSALGPSVTMYTPLSGTVVGGWGMQDVVAGGVELPADVVWRVVLDGQGLQTI